MTSRPGGVHGMCGRAVAVAAVSAIHDLLPGGVHGVWGPVDAVEAVSAVHDLVPRRVGAAAAV